MVVANPSQCLTGVTFSRCGLGEDFLVCEQGAQVCLRHVDTVVNTGFASCTDDAFRWRFLGDPVFGSELPVQNLVVNIDPFAFAFDDSTNLAFARLTCEAFPPAPPASPPPPLSPFVVLPPVSPPSPSPVPPPPPCPPLVSPFPPPPPNSDPPTSTSDPSPLDSTVLSIIVIASVVGGLVVLLLGAGACLTPAQTAAVFSLFESVGALVGRATTNKGNAAPPTVIMAAAPTVAAPTTDPTTQLSNALKSDELTQIKEMLHTKVAAKTAVNTTAASIVPSLDV